ncbi:hypothetical protein HMSSN139_62540 [Paenibacillus sp. HMSSN-139]|nr:hypothetical protein HMSSN139_62540 [Paenibacillus sp. HMSSN-139]
MRQLEQLPPDERPARLWFVGETEKHEAAIAPLIAAFGELVSSCLTSWKAHGWASPA